MVFHGSRFPYFWMTMALFPACAFGLTLEPMLESLSRPARGAVLIAVFAMLVAKAVPAGYEVTRDTQQPQREALAFIERNFPRDARGFHPESGLFCRADPAPFPTYFFQGIRHRFFDQQGPLETDWMLDQFRGRPVGFILESYRLREFPRPVQEFWWDAFVFYRHGVAVPGRHLTGEAGDVRRFEVLETGEFRVHLTQANEGARLRVAGRTLGDGESIRLEKGEYTIEFVDGIERGMIALALNDPPGQRWESFYDRNAALETVGHRVW